MADEDSSDVDRSIQAHTRAMTVLSREVGSRIDAAASKLGQQARLLKITARHRGLIDKSEYEKEIEALL